MLAKYFIMFIFIGSIFVTSDEFINASNTPKLYFVVSSLLVTTIFIAIRQKHLNLYVINSEKILWGINIICLLQACFGLFQFMGWFPSNHSAFTVTGSFDNPAGFAAILAIGFPISLYLLSKTKKVELYLASIGLGVIIIAVFLSASRTGLLAIL